MMVIGKEIKDMEMVNKYGQMEHIMMVNGKIIWY